MHSKTLQKSFFQTPLGPMIALADDEYLYLLEFHNRKNFDRQIARIEKGMNSPIIEGQNAITCMIQNEMEEYFAGTLTEFKTPLKCIGTLFQKKVWDALQKIPFGKTHSYLQVAQALNKPTAFRAVALANSNNQLAIIVPCHRVINAQGGLSGYGAGVERKKWLLEHEKNN